MKSLDVINLTIDNFSTGPKSGGGAAFAIYRVGAVPLTSCYHQGYTPLYQPYSSFNLTFDKAVKLISYAISIVYNASDSTTTYAQGALQSVQMNDLPGVKAFTNQFTATANVPITVSTADSEGSGYLEIYKLTVEKVDVPAPPVPAPLPILGAAGAFGSVGTLRKFSSLLKQG